MRDLASVVAAAEAQGLALVETLAMSANNLAVVFRAIGKPGGSSLEWEQPAF